MEKLLIFNPYYRLLVDEFSPILKSRSGWISENQDIAETDISIRIHPVHATIFSLFNGKRSTDDVIKITTSIFDNFETEELVSHIQLFIENIDYIGLHYDNIDFIFPKNILIPTKAEYKKYEEIYDIHQFLLDPQKLNFDAVRFSHPAQLLLIINTTCYTDCYYC